MQSSDLLFSFIYFLYKVDAISWSTMEYFIKEVTLDTIEGYIVKHAP